MWYPELSIVPLLLTSITQILLASILNHTSCLYIQYGFDTHKEDMSVSYTYNHITLADVLFRLGNVTSERIILLPPFLL